MKLSSLCRDLAAASILASTTVSAADLQVEIDGINQAGGTLSALLINSEEAWDGNAEPAGGRRVAVENAAPMTLRFEGIEPGVYAIRLMHDQNGNGKLDTNVVGMPLEGYGFSNNPRVMRPARFDEASFEVPAEGTSIRISLR